MDDDERIAPLVKTLKNRYLGEDFSNAGTQFSGAIKVSQLDSVRWPKKMERERKSSIYFTPGGTRTHNPWFRRPVPSPLGHRGYTFEICHHRNGLLYGPNTFSIPTRLSEVVGT